MQFYLNKVQLIGIVGRVELKDVSNSDLLSIRLVTDYSYKDNEGNWQKVETWHRIVKWNAPNYFKENIGVGDKLYVEGRLKTSKYTTADGSVNYSTDIVANEILILSKGKNKETQKEDVDSNSNDSEIENNYPF